MPLRRITSLVAILQLVLLCAADYDLLFKLDSYSNQEGSCTVRACSNGCPGFCDYNFFLCERAAGTPISYEDTVSQGNCQGVEIDTTSIAQRRNVSFSFTFSGETWPSDGVQIYVEARDRQPVSFIDRIVINVTNFPVGKTLSNQSYMGIFGSTEINATIALVCTVAFQGPTCDIFCNDNCGTCQPDFTGQFCATDIDYCANGVICGQNQRCVDGSLNYTCACEPGYTGSDCSIQIDECAGVDCNGGQCLDGINSFECTCKNGVTGVLCEVNIDHCAGVTCGQNQRCVDGILNYTCVCDDSLNCHTNSTACAEVVCHNNGECFNEEDAFTCNCPPGFTGERCEKSNSGNSIIVRAIIATVVLSAVVIVIIPAIACLIFCIKRRKWSKSASNTAGSTGDPRIHSLPFPLSATNPPDQSITTSTPIEYDYPFLGETLRRENEMCPAYSTTDSNLSCKANPAYALADISNGIVDDDHIYY